MYYLIMSSRLQSTILYKFCSGFLDDLAIWASNPWRRYSLLIIIFLIGFFVGSSLGMISGALSLMDPVGAFFTVLFFELIIRLRFYFKDIKKPTIILGIFDMLRIGLAYGLFTEALKLL